MPIFSRLIFQAVQWSARRGLNEGDESVAGELPLAGLGKFEKKQTALRAGLRGETYAYWYLRKLGYVFVAKNYMPRGVKGELDLIGYDGKTLAFVEVRTRTVRSGVSAQPEQSVNLAKQGMLVRTAHRFLADRHIGDCPTRFDVLAIDNVPGRRPVVRLHKDAFSPQLGR